MLEIRDGYGKFKERLLVKAEELLKQKEFGVEYAKFWRFLENCLSQNMLMFHFLSLLVLTAGIFTW